MSRMDGKHGPGVRYSNVRHHADNEMLDRNLVERLKNITAEAEAGIRFEVTGLSRGRLLRALFG